MITDTLVNFNLHVDGRGMAGKISKHKPVAIKVKTEAFSAGGMAAEVDVPMGSIEKMETEFSLTGYNTNVLKLLGLLPGNSVPLTARGSTAGQDGVQKAVVCQMRGHIIEVEADEWEPAKKVEIKIKMAVEYYLFQVAGETIHEVDAINCVAVIGGVDQLATVRQNLGL